MAACLFGPSVGGSSSRRTTVAGHRRSLRLACEASPRHSRGQWVDLPRFCAVCAWSVRAEARLPIRRLWTTTMVRQRGVRPAPATRSPRRRSQRRRAAGRAASAKRPWLRSAWLHTIPGRGPSKTPHVSPNVFRSATSRGLVATMLAAARGCCATRSTASAPLKRWRRPQAAALTPTPTQVRPPAAALRPALRPVTNPSVEPTKADRCPMARLNRRDGCGPGGRTCPQAGGETPHPPRSGSGRPSPEFRVQGSERGCWSRL